MYVHVPLFLFSEKNIIDIILKIKFSFREQQRPVHDQIVIK